MTQAPKPPKTYQDFVERYPKLEQAWELISEAGKEGNFDDKTIRLIKLGIAMGAMKQGSVNAGVRKALAMGITREEIEQIIALTCGTLGMSSTVAVFSWVQAVFEQEND
jgi:alkylhydroperoxidase/carboxymuconolactone decarboxylase family protein YurZ